MPSGLKKKEIRWLKRAVLQFWWWKNSWFLLYSFKGLQKKEFTCRKPCYRVWSPSEFLIVTWNNKQKATLVLGREVSNKVGGKHFRFSWRAGLSIKAAAGKAAVHQTENNSRLEQLNAPLEFATSHLLPPTENQTDFFAELNELYS